METWLAFFRSREVVWVFSFSLSFFITMAFKKINTCTVDGMVVESLGGLIEWNDS